jgi:hypothetical protein
MPARKKRLLAALFLGATGVLLFGNRLVEPRPTNPQSFADVCPLVEKMGLNFRGDRQDGGIGFRILISETPLTVERANLLCLGGREQTSKGHNDWRGVVAAYHAWDYDTDLVVPWGKIVLYGDPALIQKLTGRQPGPVS